MSSANTERCLAKSGGQQCIGNQGHRGNHLYTDPEHLIELDKLEQHYDVAGEQLPKYNEVEHYTQGAIECIDAIQSALTPEEFRGYCKGQVIKYTWRERSKGGNVDLEKALDYLRWALE